MCSGMQARGVSEDHIGPAKISGKIRRVECSEWGEGVRSTAEVGETWCGGKTPVHSWPHAGTN